jgi:hypothetical protein
MERSTPTDTITLPSTPTPPPPMLPIPSTPLPPFILYGTNGYETETVAETKKGVTDEKADCGCGCKGKAETPCKIKQFILKKDPYTGYRAFWVLLLLFIIAACMRFYK